MGFYGYDNVPSDWGSYWEKCEFCHKRYHASDGNCSCIDRLPDCACGKNDWEAHRVYLFCSETVIICRNCGSGPGDKEWVFEKLDEEEE